MKKYSKYYVTALLVFYILKVYGSLILFKLQFISDDLWRVIHYTGACIIFCSFFHLLKDKISDIKINFVITKKFIYSLGMAIFTSRLITQLSDSSGEGEEYWYEMISVVIFTTVFNFISKHKLWLKEQSILFRVFILKKLKKSKK